MCFFFCRINAENSDIVFKAYLGSGRSGNVYLAIAGNRYVLAVKVLHKGEQR